MCRIYLSNDVYNLRCVYNLHDVRDGLCFLTFVVRNLLLAD